MKTKNAAIRSIAVGFPKTVRDNEWFKENQPEIFATMETKALANVFNTKAGTEQTKSFDVAMAKYMSDPFRGTKERRVMDKDASQIDLERDTALEALRVAKLAVEDIDMILVSAFPTEHVGIGDGVFLAKALGTRKPAFNVETACSGGLASLQLAAAMVSSGQAKNVLVVVSCIYSKASDWSDTLTWFLGDGVGAYVVGEAQEEGEGFRAFHAVNTAESCGSFEYKLEDGEDGPKAIIRAGAEAGRALRDVTPRAIKDACTGVLSKAGASVEDVDFFVPNTPLAWFSELFAQTMNVSHDRTVSTYTEFANMGPALNPVNLHRALSNGSIKPGDDVLLFSIGSVSTAAAVLLRAGSIAVGSIVER